MKVSLYSDKQLQLATQIAYMNVTKEDAENALTLQELLNSDRGREIEEQFMEQYKDARDEIDLDRKDASQQMFDEIKAGTSLCSDWRVVNIDDRNDETGMYACLIETSKNNAIIAFRGSESMDAEQLRLDWLDADFGLLNSYATAQQDDAEDYVAQLVKADRQYDTYVAVGHSLGGNLAAHAGITAPEIIGSRMINCYNFDGPGFSQEYREAHKDEVERNAKKVIHYQWSLVGALLYPLKKEQFYSVLSKGRKDYMENTAESYKMLFFKHDTNFLIFDDNGNLRLSEMGAFERLISHLSKAADIIAGEKG